MTTTGRYPPDKRDVIGTIRQTFGVYALRNGWKIIEVYEETKDKNSE